MPLADESPGTTSLAVIWLEGADSPVDLGTERHTHFTLVILV
jgi:hypothetical protein